MKKIKDLMEYAAGSVGKSLVLGVVGISFLASVSTLPLPILQKYLIDAVMNADKAKCTAFLLLMIMTVMLQIIVNASSNFLASIYEQTAAVSIRKGIITNLFSASYEKLKNSDLEYLHSRIKNDSDNVAGFSRQIIEKMLSSIIVFVAAILYLAINAPVLILVMIMLLVAFFLVYFACNKGISTNAEKYKEMQSNSYSVFNQSLSNISTIKLNNMKETEKSKLDNVVKSYVSSYQKLLRFTTWFLAIASSIQVVFTVLVLAMGSYMVMKGGISIGDIFALVGFSSLILSPIVSIIQMFSIFPEARVSYERIVAMNDFEKVVDGEIVISHIDRLNVAISSFRFPDFEIVGEMNYYFEKGKIYFIHGGNGCGKSTMMNTIAGLHSSYTGEVLINGRIPMTNIREESLHSRISYIEQENHLFNGTIRENIFYFEKGEADVCEPLFNAFKASLEQLPKGLDTVIVGNTTSTISGGEMKKTSILRGLLKKADVIIMDEPTASLDVDSVSELFRILETLKKDHIIIIISHDTDYYRYADEILELESYKVQGSTVQGDTM